MGTTKLSELVQRPDGGRVFIEPARPGLADCAPTGRVRLDALARFTQDIAYADAQEAGLSDTTWWVVRRTRMRVERFPRFGQLLELATFCSGLGRMWAERRTSIAGADGARVEVVSLWVHLDPVSGRPTPLRDEELATWAQTTRGRKVTARLHHPGPDEARDSFPWRFRGTECDLAGHVNNAAYFLPLEEELVQDGDPPSIDVEIEYRSPAQPGDKTVLLSNTHPPRRWIISPDGETHASLLVIDRGTNVTNKEI
ncbi:MAG TPA: acyl-ACP thioesterase domain-containing protein [Solirubrobacteraceae bacterium]|nr:acyl-ACP thioesterase domain-containing protein [Solirubrobacteraceae bacterium]